MDISHILSEYDFTNITIATLGGHSALDVCHGVKKYGFKTLVIAQKDREQTYAKYYKTGNGKGCVDEVLVVDKFDDILHEDIQTQLRNKNTIFIHNRYFWVYFDFTKVEQNFTVPLYGSRNLLRREERDVPENQYWLLEQAGIRIPKIWKTPSFEYYAGDLTLNEVYEDMKDRLVLTKINNAERTYERENFVASSWQEWRNIASQKLSQGLITIEALQNCVIEEFILGAQINFNFFHDVLDGSLELLGTDMRRQTNLDGVLRLPAHDQLRIPQLEKYIKHIETGHVACTCKESLLEKAFLAGENFLEAIQKHTHSPIIGPFALQGAIDTQNNKEELVVFDVSFRIPGSPGTRFTPYSGYLYGTPISFGERIGMNIRRAINEQKLDMLLT